MISGENCNSLFSQFLASRDVLSSIYFIPISFSVHEKLGVGGTG